MRKPNISDTLLYGKFGIIPLWPARGIVNDSLLHPWVSQSTPASSVLSPSPERDMNPLGPLIKKKLSKKGFRPSDLNILLV
jgi:hypothetical protein